MVCEIESSRPYGVSDVAAHGTAWVVQGTEIVGSNPGAQSDCRAAADGGRGPTPSGRRRRLAASPVSGARKSPVAESLRSGDGVLVSARNRDRGAFAELVR